MENLSEQILTHAGQKWLESVIDGFKALSSNDKALALWSFINICDAAERFQILQFCNDALHRDIISLLPSELLEGIMGRLDVQDLVTACKVSRKWNKCLSQSRTLWKKKWIELGLGIDRDLSSSRAWKEECILGLKFKEMKSLQRELHLERLENSNGANGSFISAMDHCNGNVIVCHSGHRGGTVYRVTAAQWTVLCTIPMNQHGHTKCVRLLPRGLTVTGSSSGKITIWQLQEPHEHSWMAELLHALQGHAQVVTSVDACESCNVAVSGSRDKVVKLWDIATGECLKVLISNPGMDLLQVSLMCGSLSPLPGFNFLLIHLGTAISLFFWDLCEISTNDPKWVKNARCTVCALIKGTEDEPISPGVCICDGKIFYVKCVSEGCSQLISQSLDLKSIVRVPDSIADEKKTSFVIHCNVRKLLRVGLRHAMLVSHSNLIAVDTFSGREVFRQLIPFSEASSPAFPQLTSGDGKWLDGLIHSRPNALVFASASVDSVIFTMHWASDIPKFDVKRD